MAIAALCELERACCEVERFGVAWVGVGGFIGAGVKAGAGAKVGTGVDDLIGIGVGVLGVASRALSTCGGAEETSLELTAGAAAGFTREVAWVSCDLVGRMISNRVAFCAWPCLFLGVLELCFGCSGLFEAAGASLGCLGIAVEASWPLGGSMLGVSGVGYRKSMAVWS